MPFGIDFGTTNSATVEWLNGVPVQHSVRAGLPFPSLVAIDKITGHVIARGLEVKENRNYLNEECEIVTSSKTHLGTDFCQKIGNRLWTAKDIAKEIFIGLGETVTGKQSSLDEAVVAIPVGFSPIKRKELREAALEAKFKIKSFISEPTAALFRNIDKVEPWQKVAVFDWGGGTLDISLLQLDRGEYVTEIAALGIPLGGDDLDKKIAQYVYKEFQKQTGNSIPVHDLESKIQDRLLVACEAAKCQLANTDDYTIFIPNFLNGVDLAVPLDRLQLTGLIDAEYRMSLDALQKVVSDAGFSYKDIGCILMVGGSSKLVDLYHRIQHQAEDCLVIPPDEEADWQVAHGAAMLSSTPGTYIVAGNLGVELSDGSAFPLATHGQSHSICAGHLNFGIVEDIETAVFNFIRWSSDSHDPTLARIRERIGTVLVPCNGFVNESIRMKYEIDINMTMAISIDSISNGNHKYTLWNYNNLLFTYALPAKGRYHT
ncbi:Hsp70 family protein [Desulfovibrio sp. QI0430]